MPLLWFPEFVSSFLADFFLGMAFYYPDESQMLHVWNILVIGSNFYIVNVGKYFIHGTYGLEYSQVPNTTIITNEVIQFVTQLDLLLVGEFTFQKNHFIIPKKGHQNSTKKFLITFYFYSYEERVL